MMARKEPTGPRTGMDTKTVDGKLVEVNGETVVS